jgi:hypothetical protein
MSIEVMKQALDALDCIYSPLHVREINKVGAAIGALRQAIAEVEKAEPVAWMNKDGWIGLYRQGDATIPLYTHPPARKPLTDEEIVAIGRELGIKCKLGGNPNIDFDYARAIERAHGIGD